MTDWPKCVRCGVEEVTEHKSYAKLNLCFACGKIDAKEKREANKVVFKKKKEIAAVKPTKDYSSAKGPFALGKRIEKMLMDMADPKDETSVLNCGQLQLLKFSEI